MHTCSIFILRLLTFVKKKGEVKFRVPLEAGRRMYTSSEVCALRISYNPNLLKQFVFKWSEKNVIKLGRICVLVTV